VLEIIKKIQPEFLINCAAYTDVDGAEDNSDEAYKVNSESVLILSKACGDKVKFINISSDYVFDGQSTIPYTPEDIPNPLSVYGDSKYQGELATKNNCSNYIILRSSWIYSEHKKNFLKSILDLTFTNKALNIINDQVGTPTYAMDLARAIAMLLEEDIFEKHSQSIMHFCGNHVCSWHDFACAIEKHSRSIFDDQLLEKITPVSTDFFHQKATRPKYSALKTDSFFKDSSLSRDSLDKNIIQILRKLKQYG
jgi:dTDP-4-dehydrorhamnose reductase|tara:strand:- start:86 stop:841 length:756 start_codon:yes stop_codon:yes gene_type:complete